MPSISDLRNRFAMDGAVKQSLRAHADDELKPHTIEHHFVAESKAALEQLAGCTAALGFPHSPIAKGERNGETYWYFDVLSERDTNLPSLTRESVLMLALAEAFSVSYDGWGTLIVT